MGVKVRRTYILYSSQFSLILSFYKHRVTQV